MLDCLMGYYLLLRQGRSLGLALLIAAENRNIVYYIDVGNEIWSMEDGVCPVHMDSDTGRSTQ